MPAIKQVADTIGVESRRDEDGDINPMTWRPYSVTYKSLLPPRRLLPVALKRSEFFALFHKHQVLIFVGETGSGKTTQIPGFVMHYYGPQQLQKAELKIAVTQPRRLAAQETARRVAKELDVHLGEEVGFRFRGENNAHKDKGIIIFLTDGSLLAEAKTDPLLSKYACIILDEVHERTVATDILLGVLKIACQKRPDLKIVVMSATMDSSKFQNYFLNAGTQFVPGSAYPVEIFYLPQPSKDDPMDLAVETVIHIHTTESVGDVLVFVPGVKEIKSVIKKIQDRMSRKRLGILGTIKCYPLHAKLAKNLQSHAQYDLTPISDFGTSYSRRVIVATNVAETSLTIPGIVFIVDTGLVNVAVDNPRTQSEYFETVPISKANARQRSGRAGRTKPGKCFRLYTEEAMGRTTKKEDDSDNDDSKKDNPEEEHEPEPTSEFEFRKQKNPAYGSDAYLSQGEQMALFAPKKFGSHAAKLTGYYAAESSDWDKQPATEEHLSNADPDASPTEQQPEADGKKKPVIGSRTFDHFTNWIQDCKAYHGGRAYVNDVLYPWSATRTKRQAAVREGVRAYTARRDKEHLDDTSFDPKPWRTYSSNSEPRALYMAEDHDEK
ncbi:unnamed protein product [Zymoseptoria tritici ST99CH_1E4]|uniref:RNA helicase n=1 Tax=Zymoseptoria tritici ST99CH_1E4 TaxID=1276532 RepID=A0A2H1FJR3_ZYMTR|nr:unnamed protein product [Zymoseptoria tritici ST99CH_1E4]